VALAHFDCFRKDQQTRKLLYLFFFKQSTERLTSCDCSIQPLVCHLSTQLIWSAMNGADESAHFFWNVATASIFSRRLFVFGAIINYFVIYLLVYLLFNRCLQCLLPSVLWRCLLSDTKGIRPVKNWVVGCCRRGYLSGARCRLFAYGPADATATHCLLLQ